MFSSETDGHVQNLAVPSPEDVEAKTANFWVFYDDIVT